MDNSPLPLCSLAPLLVLTHQLKVDKALEAVREAVRPRVGGKAHA